MCFMAVVPAGADVQQVRFALWMMSLNWAQNPDGAGFAYAHDGQVTIRKPYWTWRSFRRAFWAAWRRYGRSTSMVGHLRFATSGVIDPLNTHPHATCRGLAMAHNGVIVGLGDAERSDTVVLAEALTNHGYDWHSLAEDHAWLGKAIGPYNKLAFILPDGSDLIVNESSGHRDLDVWFSTPAPIPTRDLAEVISMQGDD